MRMNHWTPGLLPAALLVGCAAVGPDYVSPELTVPVAFSGQEARSVSPTDHSLWWKELGDPVLDGLVDDVLQANLDLAGAVERVENARALYGIVRADQGPSVSANGGYSRSRPLGFGTQNQWTIGGRASWEIDLFGRVRRSMEASLANFEAEVADLGAVRVALIAETVATYLQCVSLRERIAIARSNVEGQERSKDIADQRFDAGMAAGLDPAQADVNLARTQASVPALELALRRSLHRLSVLAGRDPASSLESAGTGAELPDFPGSLSVGIPADLIRNPPGHSFLGAEACRPKRPGGGGDRRALSCHSVVGVLGLAGIQTGGPAG